MSCIDLLFKSYYNYEFKCFGNYCHNKIKFISFTDINRLIYITSQWEVISVYDNKISGYCTECIKLRDKKTEEQLKLTINEIKYLNNEVERLTNEVERLTKTNLELKKGKNNNKCIERLIKNIESKFTDKNYLKSIYLDNTKPSNISWDTIDYILKHTENLTQNELDKMSDTQKMQLV